jgi:hypothetical protein
MSIPKAGRQFCICYWLDPESDGPEDHYEYTDSPTEAEEKAKGGIRGGKYRWAQVCCWDYGADDWALISDHEEENSY